MPVDEVDRNPVTNRKCATSGTTCHCLSATSFICSLSGLDYSLTLCEANCLGSGAECGPGLPCVNNRCAALCCRDADGGPQGVCHPELVKKAKFRELGVCMLK